MQKLFEDIYIHLKNNRCLKEALNSAFWGIFKIKKATFKSCFFGADGQHHTSISILDLFDLAAFTRFRLLYIQSLYSSGCLTFIEWGCIKFSITEYEM